MNDTGYNAYKALADRVRLSEPTIRKALSRRPITYRTARRIAEFLSVPIECFRIIEDGRGKRKRGSVRG